MRTLNPHFNKHLQANTDKAESKKNEPLILNYSTNNT
jgi:hypothetical protein